MSLNAAKYQGFSFYNFWVIKGKPIGGGGNSYIYQPLSIAPELYQ